jgi:hypothetical protein
MQFEVERLDLKPLRATSETSARWGQRAPPKKNKTSSRLQFSARQRQPELLQRGTEEQAPLLG